MFNKLTRDKGPGGKIDRILSKDYILVLIASLGGTFMHQSFLAVMPLYIVKIGGAQVDAGMMTTAFALAALAARPVSGISSDKFGRVKHLIIGSLISSVACVAFGYVYAIPLMLVFRALTGIGFGIFSTSAGAAIVDVVPKSRLAEGLGYYGLYTTISISIAPMLALFVVSGDTLGDFRNLFMISAAAYFVCAIVSCFVTYERKRKTLAPDADVTPETCDADASDAPSSEGCEPLPKTFFGFEYAVFIPALVIIMVYGGQAGILGFLTPFSRSKGIDNPSLYYIFHAIGVFASRVFFGKVIDKRGSDIIVIPAMVLLGVCLLVLPYVGSLTELVLIGLPFGLSIGSVLTSMSAMIFRRCSTARRGTASGAYTASIDLAWSVGTPLLGAFVDMRGFTFMYDAGAVMVFMGLALYILLCSDRKYNARRLKEK